MKAICMCPIGSGGQIPVELGSIRLASLLWLTPGQGNKIYRPSKCAQVVGGSGHRANCLPGSTRSNICSQNICLPQRLARREPSF